MLKWYYVFQVLQVFLVTTLSSGAAAVASQIAQDPSSVPQLLAERLPRASNTYLTYFVVQALTNAPSNILNYTDVLFYVFYDKFWDKTPRQKYNTYTSMRGMSWGKLFPKYGNFVIIGKSFRHCCEKAWLIPSSDCLCMHCTTRPWLCCNWPCGLLLELSIPATVYRTTQDRHQRPRLHACSPADSYRHLHC